MEHTQKIERREYILDDPRKAKLEAIKIIASVPGLQDCLKNHYGDDIDEIILVEQREINAHLMGRTSKYHDQGENKEVIIALSNDGAIIGEVDNIPQEESLLDLFFGFFNLKLETKKPENVLAFLKRLEGSKVKNISSIVSIVPSGKILIYKKPVGFENVYDWLNTKGKEIEEIIVN